MRIVLALFGTALVAVITLLALELRWSRAGAQPVTPAAPVSPVGNDLPRAPTPPPRFAQPSRGPSLTPDPPAASTEAISLHDRILGSGAPRGAWSDEAGRLIGNAERLIAARGFGTVRQGRCHGAGCLLEIVYPSPDAQEGALEALRDEEAIGRWPGALVESPVEPDGHGGLTQFLYLMPRPNDDS